MTLEILEEQLNESVRSVHNILNCSSYSIFSDSILLEKEKFSPKKIFQKIKELIERLIKFIRAKVASFFDKNKKLNDMRIKINKKVLSLKLNLNILKYKTKLYPLSNGEVDPKKNNDGFIIHSSNIIKFVNKFMTLANNVQKNIASEEELNKLRKNLNSILESIPKHYLMSQVSSATEDAKTLVIKKDTYLAAANFDSDLFEKKVNSINDNVFKSLMELDRLIDKLNKIIEENPDLKSFSITKDIISKIVMTINNMMNIYNNNYKALVANNAVIVKSSYDALTVKKDQDDNKDKLYGW